MKVLVILLFLFPSFAWSKYSVSSFQNEPCSYSTLMSGPHQVNLIELYTSEGCSSCPPKDSWMNDLIHSPHLYKSFVPLKFHVDYWNYLGWRDPFSKGSYTQRQYLYGRQWQNNRIYTPNFVFNGKEWFIQDNLNQNENKIGVLKAKRESTLSFSIQFIPLKSYNNLVIYGSLLGNGFSSKVKSGENRGKTLEHNFVVLDLKEKKMRKKKKIYNQNLSFELPKGLHPKSLAYAFWVATEDSIDPLQAVGGCFK